MKIVTFRTEQGLQSGVLTEKGIVPVNRTVDEILTGGRVVLEELNSYAAQQLQAETAELLNERNLELAPCVPNPGKIICIGLNYRRHAEESKMAIPKHPILFNKFSNALAGSGESVEIPFAAEQIDYEAELAIVIGRTAHQVPQESALDVVFGYCAANDLSARDLQFRTNQWLLGKSCDGFAPLGPYLVTADEAGNPNNLEIRSYVNGELRQNSNTADMIFDCSELVSYISNYMTLQPGDVILTGTPEGVIMGYPPEKQVWLKPGDEVAVEIEKLGRLVNRIRS